eukprot:m.112882 g.112882  ORF g.112882 m.112882 type:complete len:1069 (+) comp15423_c0_seq2:14-3220(+)
MSTQSWEWLAFHSHSWENSSEGHPYHRRVAAIHNLLQSEYNITGWLDEERMAQTGSIIKGIGTGGNGSLVFVAYVSRCYMEKLDNVMEIIHKEADSAVLRKQNQVFAILDGSIQAQEIANTSLWVPLHASVGSDDFKRQVEQLARRITALMPLDRVNEPRYLLKLPSIISSEQADLLRQRVKSWSDVNESAREELSLCIVGGGIDVARIKRILDQHNIDQHPKFGDTPSKPSDQPDTSPLASAEGTDDTFGAVSTVSTVMKIQIDALCIGDKTLTAAWDQPEYCRLLELLVPGELCAKQRCISKTPTMLCFTHPDFEIFYRPDPSQCNVVGDVAHYTREKPFQVTDEMFVDALIKLRQLEPESIPSLQIYLKKHDIDLSCYIFKRGPFQGMTFNRIERQLALNIMKSTRILEVHDKLTALLRPHEKYIKLNAPRIVVVGDSTSGKSSFISAICGFDLLPTGMGRCTVCPIILRLERGKPSHAAGRSCWGVATFEFRGEKEEIEIGFENTAALKATLEEYQKRISHPSPDVNIGSIVADELTLTISAPTLRNLTLVDLPGVTESSTDDNKTDGATSKELLQTYCKPSERNIIVLVLDGNAPSSSATSRLLQEQYGGIFPPPNSICVLTKIDIPGMMRQHLQILKGSYSTTLPCAYGVAVEKSSPIDRTELEKQAAQELKQALNDRSGSVYSDSGDASDAEEEENTQPATHYLEGVFIPSVPTTDEAVSCPSVDELDDILSRCGLDAVIDKLLDLQDGALEKFEPIEIELVRARREAEADLEALPLHPKNDSQLRKRICALEDSFTTLFKQPFIRNGKLTKRLKKLLKRPLQEVTAVDSLIDLLQTQNGLQVQVPGAVSSETLRAALSRVRPGVLDCVQAACRHVFDEATKSVAQVIRGMPEAKRFEPLRDLLIRQAENRLASHFETSVYQLRCEIQQLLQTFPRLAPSTSLLQALDALSRDQRKQEREWCMARDSQGRESSVVQEQIILLQLHIEVQGSILTDEIVKTFDISWLKPFKESLRSVCLAAFAPLSSHFALTSSQEKERIAALGCIKALRKAQALIALPIKA